MNFQMFYVGLEIEAALRLLRSLHNYYHLYVRFIGVTSVCVNLIKALVRFQHGFVWIVERWFYMCFHSFCEGVHKFCMGWY